MKRWRIALPLLAHALFATPLAPPATAAQTVPSAYDIARPSVVTVNARSTDGDASLGSGVVVGARRVVTNCHVVRFAATVTVRDADGQDLSAQTVLADEERDLCLLEVAGLKGQPARRRPGAEKPMTGEPVIAVGNPLGLGISTSSGLLSAVVEKQGAPHLIVSVPLSPGSSGGGLFDASGRLLGITTAIMQAGQNTNLALPATWIDELPGRGKPPVALPPAPPAEPDWAFEAERLRAAGDWTALEQWCVAWQKALPDASEAWRLRALALNSLGRDREAESDLRRALAAHPRNYLAWAELANLLSRGGRDRDAIEALAAARAIYPGSGYHDLVDAQRLIRSGKFDAAYPLALRGNLRSSTDPSIGWVLLAHIAEEQKRPREAARALRIALAQQPGNAAWSAALSRALLAMGDVKGARQAVSGLNATQDAAQLVAVGREAYVQHRLADAEQSFRKALALDPAADDASIGLAAVLYETGRSEAGAKLVEAVLANDPEHPNAWRLKSSLLARERKLNEAADALGRALARQPDEMDTLRQMITLEQATHRWSSAYEHARHLVSLAQSQTSDKVTLAQILIRGGKLEAAERLIEEARREMPDDLATLLALAAVQGQRGDNAGALEIATRASTLHPTSGAAWSSRGYSLFKLGRLDEAVPALETAVRLEPDEANGWINLGNALLHQRQIKRAVEALERAYSLSPDSTDGTLYLAQAYAASGQNDKALLRLDELLARNPGRAQLWYLKGISHAQLGNAEELKRCYLKLIDIDRAAADKLRKGIARVMPKLNHVFASP